MENQKWQDIQNKLQETREIVERNNEILKSINSKLFWQRVMSILYWVIIIGIAVGALYFIQPYIDRLLNTYSQIKEGLDAIPKSGL